ncbi:MAG: hypothetical protein AAGG44_01185 [Planctomycetota bacterium]
MGLNTSGIPREIVARLAGVSGAKTFVETGTFQGATTRWAAGVFAEVHTIELARGLFDEYSPELARIEGVHPHFGDSATKLPEIVSSLGDEPSLFWLDGHWSGGETAGEQAECPIIPELECLTQRPRDLILIDDARFFLCAPPRPHKPSHWPTIAEIVRTCPGDRFVQVIDDVIFIVPDNIEVRSCLVEYAQERAAFAHSVVRKPYLHRIANRLLGKQTQ